MATGDSLALHVNIDHVATLRQARGTHYPDPVWAASLVELARADGITIHLREDRRHIQDRDVRVIRQTVERTFNLEMAATDEMVAIAREVRPDVVTLVPEKREERTTEGGLDVLGAGRGATEKAIHTLKNAGMEGSLFIDPTSGISVANYSSYHSNYSFSTPASGLVWFWHLAENNSCCSLLLLSNHSNVNGWSNNHTATLNRLCQKFKDQPFAYVQIYKFSISLASVFLWLKNSGYLLRNRCSCW